MKTRFLAAALVLTAIAGCKSTPSGSPVSTASSNAINGAGATFPNPIYSKWFSDYNQAHPEVKINYQSIGSGGGIRQVTEGTVDFGASDGPMSDAALASSAIKIVHIPTVMGAVVPVYNLPGVTTDLKFSPEALAGIYLNNIKTWNDPVIAKDNPGVALPAQPILPVYRSDGSGTTFIFTDWLSKVSPEWKSKVGAANAVKWPAGIGEKGSEGIAGIVRQSKYTFGYVELVYAQSNHMQYGLVRNHDGVFIKASTASVTAAGAAYADKIPADYRVSITDAPGADSYPISSFTWLLIPSPAKDSAKGQAIIGFLNWMVDKGEGEAAGMTYAPLPPAIAERVKATIATLK